MYAKCNVLDEASRVFHGIVKKNSVSWNATLQGLAMHKHGEKALELFSQMVKAQVLPDKLTFIRVLCACAHVANTRLQMRSTGVQKPPRASSIEVDDKVREFTVFYKLHPKSDEVYWLIDRLRLDLKQLNVSPGSISNGIGGWTVKDNIYLVSIS
ncbi:hypothetical protein FF1_045121 [Malus domestica]